jgi:hypothetical protein
MKIKIRVNNKTSKVIVRSWMKITQKKLDLELIELNKSYDYLIYSALFKFICWG